MTRIRPYFSNEARTRNPMRTAEFRGGLPYLQVRTITPTPTLCSWFEFRYPALTPAFPRKTGVFSFRTQRHRCARGCSKSCGAARLRRGGSSVAMSLTLARSRPLCGSAGQVTVGGHIRCAGPRPGVRRALGIVCRMGGVGTKNMDLIRARLFNIYCVETSRDGPS